MQQVRPVFSVHQQVRILAKVSSVQLEVSDKRDKQV